MAETRSEVTRDLVMVNSNVLAAVALVGVLGLMVIPVPTALLDVLLTFNIAIAMVMLLVTIYLRHPLEFSVFPSLLLIVTLFRLSLNVASTRLILSKGEAGRVIEAFGEFVVGGSMVIGIIVFLILVVVQFVVITKGSGRIAEVAARFTLDAMPGKQMAIDADLNSGLITEAEARGRRERIAQEAEFYGAMDGASKFVRGDAIAGILITVVNIVGGLIIGTMQHGMSIAESAATFTLLTTGDGLVSQIPALFVSTAAGMVVTRSASGLNLGQDIGGQLLRDPRALFGASAALAAFALIPGLPTVPFLVLAAASGLAGFRARTRAQDQIAEEEAEMEEVEREDDAGDVSGEDLFVVDRLELEIGYGLIPLVDATRGGDLLTRVTNVRRKTGTELGIQVAPIRIRDNLELEPYEYGLKLRGVEIARYQLKLTHVLAMRMREGGPDVGGISTVEPAFNLPAVWIRSEDRASAEMAGYTVVEPSAVVATHLSEVIKSHADEILSRQDVKEMLDRLRDYAPALVEEVVPEKVSTSVLHGVLQGLLHERVPVRDLITILEVLASVGATTEAQVDALVERVRAALARGLSHMHADGDRVIHALTVHPESEQSLFLALKESERSGSVSMDPGFAERFVDVLGRMVEQVVRSGKSPLLVVSSPIRLFTRRLLEASYPSLAVLGYTELAAGYQVRSLGTVIAHEEHLRNVDPGADQRVAEHAGGTGA